MSIWGATVKAGVKTPFSSEDGVLELTHLTLLSGKHAHIKFRQMHDANDSGYLVLAHLNSSVPSIRTQVVLDADTEFLVEGDPSSSVSVVGNIRLDSFPASESSFSDSEEDLLGALSDSTDEENESDSDDLGDDWETSDRLQTLLKLVEKHRDTSASSSMASRVVDVTDEPMVQGKQSPLSLPSSIQEKPSFGKQVEEATKRTAAGGKCLNESLTEPKMESKLSTGTKKVRTTQPEKEAAAKAKTTPVETEKKNVSNAALTEVNGVSITKTLPGNIKYSILTVGSGKTASVGKRVKVRYEGRLASNGKKFDSGTLDFTIGAGEMIKGFDLGVRGMLQKEKRKIWIPSRLAYGKQKVGGIPPNSDLIFEISLLSVS